MKELGADGTTPLWNGYRSGRDKELRRTYGLTEEQYELILTAQGGVCGSCGKRPGRKALAVDEDHDTNEIRGLLHVWCNRAITVGVSRYLKDPPARRVGSFFVSADRAAKRDARKVVRAATKRTTRSAETTGGGPTTEEAANYAAKVAAALRATERN